MLDLPALLDRTSLADAQSHAQLDSTNQHALRLLRSSEPVRLPLLIHAESQTAGRGRSGSRWLSARGSVLFSLVLSGEALPIPERQRGVLSLLVGLAAAEASAERLPPDARSALRLKWPNDLLIGEGKLAGILIEAENRSGASACVVGVGMNLNSRSEPVAEQTGRPVASLSEAAGGTHDPTDWLIGFCNCLDERIAWYASEPQALPAAWAGWSALDGRRVVVSVGGEEIAGECVGVSDSGALRLRTSDGVTEVRSGHVVRWE